MNLHRENLPATGGAIGTGRALRLATLLALAGLAPVCSAQQKLKSIVPRFDVAAPIGTVVDWDRTFVFNDVPAASAYMLEVQRPKFGSCVLPARAGLPERLTGAASGGIFKQTYPRNPPAGAAGAVCRFGECRITVPTFGVPYYEPVGLSGSLCRTATKNYVWSVRTEDGHFTDRTAFLPTKSHYDF